VNDFQGLNLSGWNRQDPSEGQRPMATGGMFQTEALANMNLLMKDNELKQFNDLLGVKNLPSPLNDPASGLDVKSNFSLSPLIGADPRKLNFMSSASAAKETSNNVSTPSQKKLQK